MGQKPGALVCPWPGRFYVYEIGVAELCFAMALVRILVDGYSLLHNWPTSLSITIGANGTDFNTANHRPV